MKYLYETGVALALAAALATSPALAGPEVDACGAAVASPWEPGQRQTGIEWWKVDIDAAIAACEAAVAAEPDSAAAQAWLGRALSLANRMAEAAPLVADAAEAGNVLGMTIYGNMLRKGDGVTQDIERGRAMLEEAIAKGSVSAQLYLGEMLEQGAGGVKDPDRAIELYTSALEAGNGEAATYLGFFYEDGSGGTVDERKAAMWYQRGTDMGDPVSTGNLGYAYRQGVGVPVDHRKAFELLTVAASHDLGFAINNLAGMYDSGEGVRRDGERAFELYQQAAALGDSNANVNLGMAYMTGTAGVVEQDYAKAADYLLKAADAKNSESYPYLVMLYYNGAGVEKSIDRAIEYAELGTGTGSTNSMTQLGSLLRERGTDEDYVRSLNLTLAAAGAGNADAMANVALHYIHGYGVEADGGEALMWATRGADKGSALAQFMLGELFERGFGVPQDLDRARGLYQKAANGGSAEGTAALARLDAGEPIMPLE